MRRTGEAKMRMSWKNLRREPRPKLTPKERTSGMKIERESRGARTRLAGSILTVSHPAPKLASGASRCSR